MNIIEKIKQKGVSKEKIARDVLKNPGCITDILEGLDNDKGTIRLGCEKVLRLISEQKPERLYPHFNEFVKLLDSKNNILKWGAIIIISNLVSVDSENKFEKIFDKYFISMNLNQDSFVITDVATVYWELRDNAPQGSKYILKVVNGNRDIVKAAIKGILEKLNDKGLIK